MSSIEATAHSSPPEKTSSVGSAVSAREGSEALMQLARILARQSASDYVCGKDRSRGQASILAPPMALAMFQLLTITAIVVLRLLDLTR